MADPQPEDQLAQALLALERGDYRAARARWEQLPAEVRERDERAQRIERQTGVDRLGLVLGLGGALLLCVLALIAYGRVA